jgi:hypothetical protein
MSAVVADRKRRFLQRLVNCDNFTVMEVFETVVSAQVSVFHLYTVKRRNTVHEIKIEKKHKEFNKNKHGI